MPNIHLAFLLLISMCFVVESSTSLFSCRDEEFECDDGSCIDFKYLCDREDDCPNREDEIECPKCPKKLFLCGSSNQTCIHSNYVCDSHPDCADASDESDCYNAGNPSTLIPTSYSSSILAFSLSILFTTNVGKELIIG